MSVARESVVVVGAGITGVACARALAARGVAVVVRERSRVPGGRLASCRRDGRVVDHGASYFTVREPDFARVVAAWERAGLARRWTDRFHVARAGRLEGGEPGPMRYAAPAGLRSLVADLASTLDVRYESPVTRVSAGPRVDGTAVRAVVLAMPDPQAERLLDPDLPDVRAAVAPRAWDPVLALLARYEARAWPELDGVFVHDDPAITWIADDGRRRGDGAPVLVAHSTSALAAAHLGAAEGAGPELVAAVARTLGVGLPPVASEVHRWGFARPRERRSEPFGLGPELVGLAGDGWGEPRVETAWRSGDALGHALAARLASS